MFLLIWVVLYGLEAEVKRQLAESFLSDMEVDGEPNQCGVLEGHVLKGFRLGFRFLTGMEETEGLLYLKAHPVEVGGAVDGEDGVGLVAHMLTS